MLAGADGKGADEVRVKAGFKIGNSLYAKKGGRRCETTVRLAANFAAYCIKRECTLAMLIKCGDLSAGRPKHGLPQISFARKQKIG
jgi:hypothetical protein